MDPSTAHGEERQEGGLVSRRQGASGARVVDRRTRVMRIVTLVLGLVFAAYALSDHPFYGGERGFGTPQKLILLFGIVLALTTRFSPRWNQRVLSFTASSLFALLLLELMAEVALRHRYRPVFMEDQRLLFKLIPDRTSEFIRSSVNGGQHILTRINHDGFVGEPLQKTGSSPRVIVYGDSFLHAFYVTPETRFTSELERLLSRDLGRSVEVINAGVASYGPDQISLRMPEELRTLRPDLVVVSVFAGNDFGDLMRNKMFRIDERGAFRENEYHLAAEVSDRFATAQRESILVRALRQELGRFTARSPYAGLGQGKDPNLALMDAWMLRAADEYRSAVTEHDHTVTNTHEDLYNADLSLTPNTEASRYKVRLMDGVLRRIGDIATRASVPLVFLFIPHPMDVADGYDTGRVDLPRFPDYRRNNLTDALEGIARGASFHYVNLFEPFRTHDAIKLYFHAGDDHWNEAGQRLAAETMNDYLKQQDLLARLRR
jgi:lysophospholipase L1-like esterase